MKNDGAGSSHEAETPRWVLKLCFYCSRPLTRRDRTRDHLIPLSRGGWPGAANTVPACRRCNVAKGSMILREYRALRNVEAFPGERFYAERVARADRHDAR
jgi:5-methylcytosine-specific restriction endonuclease McrA